MNLISINPKNRYEDMFKQPMVMALSHLILSDPEYAKMDATPQHDFGHGGPINPDDIFSDHGCFFSDAYRTVANIGLDTLWNGPNPEYQKVADNLINFFLGFGILKKICQICNRKTVATPIPFDFRHF